MFSRILTILVAVALVGQAVAHPMPMPMRVSHSF